MSHLFGILLMFLAACSFGISGILIKLAYRAGLQPAELLPLQNLVAVICLWPMLLLSRAFHGLGRKQVHRLVWQGLIGNFGISVCYFWSAQRIDVSLLSIILFTYPGFVLLYLMVVERRRIAVLEFIALTLALAGGVLAADPFRLTPGRIDRLGAILAVGAAVAYAFMNVYGQKLARGMSSLAITTVTSTVSTLALTAVLPPQRWLAPDFSGRQWLFIVSLGMFSTVIPMNLLYLGIRRIGAFHASIVSIVELPCILALAYLILHERMGALQVLGGGMILAGLVLVQLTGHSGGGDPLRDA